MEHTTILENHYNLHETSLQYLEGFEDKTYKVSSLEGDFIFKEYRYSEETAAIIEVETELLRRLSSVSSFSFPRTFPTNDNQSYLISDGVIYRLISFLEGNLLGDASHTDEMLRSFGTLLGRMDRNLSETDAPTLRGRENPWDLCFFRLNLKYLPYIEDESDRSLVRYFFLQFEECVGPVADRLRKSVIHNDANDWNVITNGKRVTGLFDFGDIAYSWLINELAIGITYAMMNKEHPLQAAVEVIKGYHKEYALQELELDILYYLVGARLCISVCNSAYGKITRPNSDYMTISEIPAWALLKKWLQINPLSAKRTFREAVGFSYQVPISTELLLQHRQKYLSKSLSLSYDTPISMHSAAFQYMYDTKGNTFLDAYNNIMLVGHCHPWVVDRGQRAMARLNTNTRYLYDSIYLYAEKLLQKFPDRLSKIFFVNSGSEATDLAIRMARYHTDKSQIIVLENGYHGHTSTGIEISHYKYASEKGIGKSSYVIETPMPKAFGSGFADDGSCGLHFADLTKSNMAPFVNDIAAFIAEPIMGCAGQVPLAKNFLKEVYAEVRKHGGVCISDEVQVGFGRLGVQFWGFQLHDVIPDIVVLGKPMGNGHPIGAVVTTEEIAASFERGPEFFSSFGGNPVSCAIGLAVLDVIETEKLQMKAKEVGDYLKGLLLGLQKKYPVIAEVRGYGMFLGVEMADSKGIPKTDLAQRLKNKLREHYILIGTDGPHENVIKLKPPLPFNKANAGILAYKLDLIMQSFL